MKNKKGTILKNIIYGFKKVEKESIYDVIMKSSPFRNMNIRK